MTGAIEFGFAATAVDAPGASDGELYRSLLAECELNRSLGFTTAWALEHHFSDYFPTPDILLLLANLAPRFPDMGLGTAVIVTPWHNPLRLAEQIAMLSVLGDGPLHLGLGRGTAKFEFDAFDMDMEESRRRFQESWEILQLALTGEPFSYKGELYQVPGRSACGRARRATAFTSTARSGARPARRSWAGSACRPSARRSATWRCRPRRSRTGRPPPSRAAWTPSTSRSRSW